MRLFGSVVASTAMAGGPPNDDCANAIDVVAGGSYGGTTIGAANDSGGSGCGHSATTPDVWYRYVPAENGTLQAQACNTLHNLVLSVWDGCPDDDADEFACDHDSCGLGASVLAPVSAGATYYIRVSGFDGAVGPYTLEIDQVDIIGPDVVYSDIDCITLWGEVEGVCGYSLQSDTCNIGDLDLDWGGNTPLLAMNAYRIADGRIEQIGMSWVKNGTGATAFPGCGSSCNGNGGNVLGAGCLDVYGCNFNGIQSILGPRSDVNAFTGDYPGSSGGTGDAIYKRLQIATADLQVDDALYFVEGQYVAHDDASFDNAHNNASYKQVLVQANLQLTVVDPMYQQEAAIYAWHDHGLGIGQPDPSVMIAVAHVPDEGRFQVGSKATDLGGGQWRYEYAVRNHDSHRSGGGFSVPVPDGVTVTNVGFSDVDYHSGELYDNSDWVLGKASGAVVWESPQPFGENQNTNALRFGTMYNFRFDADAAPADGDATITLFRPGTPDSIPAPVRLPGGTEPCVADLDGNDEVNVLDLVALITSWGPCGSCAADLDGDGDVGVSDLILLIVSWGAC